MSNNDDDCLESWEELEDSGALERQLAKLAAKCDCDINGGSSSNNISSVVLINTDGQMRFGPPQPGVKILKRPNGFHNSFTFGEEKPKLPIKTLQQREVEYAIARERILGEAPSLTSETECTESQLKILSESKPMERYQISHQRQEGTMNGFPHFGILRQPKGPDGTSGFALPR